jgi:hypothetical protein
MDAAQSLAVKGTTQPPGCGIVKVPFRRLIAESFREWQDDNILRHSAGLAYYAIFALAPLLVIVLSIAGAAFGEEAVRGQLYHQLHDLMGNEAASIVQDMVAKSHPKQERGGDDNGNSHAGLRGDKSVRRNAALPQRHLG